MPSHELKLKKNCVVMLIRNMNASRGLYNGTRLIVRNISQNLLDCEILTGSNIGQRVFIPKLKLEPSDTDFSFTFRRFQFPVKLSYSMTIQKNQGQSFSHVGIWLNSQIFTHGQLYTALSRVKNKDNLKIDPAENVVDGKVWIKNVVYEEMLH